jgi:tryptophanyl-tRNA synthetase
MTRDVASRLKYEKTACFYSTFFPALQGLKSKMASSDATSSILLTDSPADVKKKVNKYAFSGGGATLEEHRANGANLEVDVPFQWLKFFLEDDDRLAEIKDKYGRGEMLTGEIKAILIDTLNGFLKEF